LKTKNIPIGFDIDDVTLNIAPLLFGDLKKTFPHINRERSTTFDIAKEFDVDPQTVSDIIYNTVSRNMFHPNYYCKETLTNFKNNVFNNNYEIYLITSRSDTQKKHTLKNLKLRFGDLICYDNVIFSTKKYEVINSLGLKVFVDDRAKILTEIYENTNCTPVCFNQKWNENLNTGIIRVYTWKDINNLFMYSSSW